MALDEILDRYRRGLLTATGALHDAILLAYNGKPRYYAPTVEQRIREHLTTAISETTLSRARTALRKQGLLPKAPELGIKEEKVLHYCLKLTETSSTAILPADADIAKTLDISPRTLARAKDKLHSVFEFRDRVIRRKA